MFPGYTVSQALKEPAVTFFVMLAAGQRVVAAEQITFATLSSWAYMDEEARSELSAKLQSRTVDPDLIELDSDDYSGIEQIKEILD